MKVCLIILDGWGHNVKKVFKDAIQDSKCENMKRLSKKYPSFLIHASGKYVGLHDNNIGNSEVGHLTLGAGRIIKQNIILIDEEFKNCTIKDKLNPLISLNKNRLHLIGMVSDGGIHSHIKHLKGLIINLHKNFKQIFIHCISDGRDTAPNVFFDFLNELNEHCFKYENCRVVSLSGRYFAMDRDNNKERTNKYFEMITGNTVIKDIKKYIQHQYSNGRNDENIIPAMFDNNGKIYKEDVILFFNFRADRMRQIVKKFLVSDYIVFTLTEYDKNSKANVIFHAQTVKNTLADVLENNGVEQVYIAETEKYAHITYFFNGGNERIHIKEKRIIINSLKTESFATIPEMSSRRITDEIITNLNINKEFIVANFAAPDMVGHTGDYEATIKAIEFIDLEIGRIYTECKKNGYALIITADHGNAEIMYDTKNQVINKKHTNNKVPLIIIVPKKTSNLILSEDQTWEYKNSEYSLANVAPTILHLLNIDIPQEFTGTPIIF